MIDAIYIEDASGVLTPDKAYEFVSTVKANSNGIPIEFHSHCNSGLAPLCYLEAVKAGADILHTAVAPLANGTSLPAIQNILKNVRHMGYQTDINDEALETVTAHFTKVAQENGFPIGVPEEYDLFHFEHQVPGGMMTNLKRQLAEMKMEDRLDEFLTEIVQVRKDLGYPIMATPYSQVVGTQAVENVMQGERYKKILDQTVKYVMGHYGEVVGPIDEGLMERIKTSPETQKLLNWTPEGRGKPLSVLRDEIGHAYDDDEFLLRVLIPGLTARPGTGKNPRQTRPTPKTKQQGLPIGGFSSIPNAFAIDVDGETFNVKITPLDDDGQGSASESMGSAKPREISPGAVLAPMAGLVVSVDAEKGQAVCKGDLLAKTEAMKMIREVLAPHDGTVSDIYVQVGDMIDAEDPLIVVEQKDE